VFYYVGVLEVLVLQVSPFCGYSMLLLRLFNCVVLLLVVRGRECTDRSRDRSELAPSVFLCSMNVNPLSTSGCGLKNTWNNYKEKMKSKQEREIQGSMKFYFGIDGTWEL